MGDAAPPADGSLLAVIGDEVGAGGERDGRGGDGGGRAALLPDTTPPPSPTPMPPPSPPLQDTVTGFLLAGVGHVDLRRSSNFFIVNESE